MDFPQQPQGATPFPSAPQPTTPPPFPSVASTVEPMVASSAGPLPGPTMPPLGSSPLVPPPVQIPVQSHDEQVYTMPDKFLAAAAPTATRSKKPSKVLTIALITLIVLMVLAAIGGVLYYFLVLAKQQPIETAAQNAVVVNTNNANNQVNVANTNTTVNANATANTNVNVNSDVNANDNTNVTVVNANANTNAANSNANLNTNTNVNATVNANDNTNAAVTVPPASKDTDADSLTNDEEKIWSTKADLPDTDTDGYVDGIEILAGYDPTDAVGRLSASTLISTFANSEYGYTMLYPKNWLAESLDNGDAAEVLFTPNALDLAGQFVVVTVTENPTGLIALDWYVDTTGVDEADVETVVAFNGTTGVWSTDRTTAYYASTNNVYAISYRYGDSDELYFPTSFEMMVQSFALSAQE